MNSILFELDGRIDLANKVLKSANSLVDFEFSTTLGGLNAQKFSDGELCVDYINSVRGKRVYLLTSPNTSDQIMKLMLAIDAAKRAGAKEIVPILPYFPYARQDKKDQSRGPIGAKVMASMLEGCGATTLITFDLHADQIQGFFNIPITHIEGKNVFDTLLADMIRITPNTVLCGPDAGSGKRVKRMVKQLAKKGVVVSYVMMDKTRSEANVVDSMDIIGDVENKHVIIIDDMVDTAGTLCKAAEELLNAGASAVSSIISHGVLSGAAYDNISKSKLLELIISDSLSTKAMGGITVVSVNEQIGLAIASINSSKSYEELNTIK